MTNKHRAQEALKERVKEIRCLQRVRNAVHGNPDLEELCPRIAAFLAEGMHVPDWASVKIEIDGRQFTHGDRADGPTGRLEAAIETNGQVVGGLSVSYCQEQPFLLPFEQDLVDAVATILGHHMERRQAARAQHLTQKQLAESLSFTQSLLSALPVPVFVKDCQGRYLSCNRAFAELLGMTAEQVRGKTVDELWPGEFAKVHRRRDQEVLASGDRQEYEYRIRDREGKGRDVMFVKDVFRDSAGTVSGIVGAYVDITERKQAEQRLRDSRRWMSIVIDAALDAIIMLDPQGNISLWNVAAERIFGYTSAEAIGRSLHKLLAPTRFHEGHFQAFAEFRRTGCGKALGRVLELAAVRKNGEEFPIELSLSAIPSASGWQAVGVLRDITERKRGEAALQTALDESLRHQAETSALLEATRSVLRHRAFKDAARSIFAVCRQRVGAAAGYVALLADGEASPDVVCTDSDDASWTEETARAAGLSSLQEAVCRTGRPAFENGRVPSVPGGAPLRVCGGVSNALVAPLALDGRVAGVIALANKRDPFTSADAELAVAFADIAAIALTNSRNLEDLMKGTLQLEQYTLALESANQALEDFNRVAQAATLAKSEFLANMSHEIRTPMTAILGYTDVLAGSLQDPEHLEAVNTIRRNGDHLLRLLNDILDLSKVEAGKVQVERLRCSPAELLADVVSLMRVRAVGKGVGLKLEFAGPCPASVCTDPTRLRQILVNLVGNAVKFTEAGEIRVVLSLAHLGTPQPRLRCEVIDSGIGMSTEQVAQLFQPFHQVDTSTSRKFDGTGLGLAISKRLAELLGGDIRVQSSPGKGSRFCLDIDPGPLADVALLDDPAATLRAPTPAIAPAREPAAPPLAGCRVLLAEDGPDNQRLVSFLLKKAGAEVRVAPDGQKAMELALATFPGRGRRYNDPREPFHVILMDMQMPVMDGYESTRRLRAAGYTAPIIALTANTMADDRRKCLDAGCDDFVSKPIDRQGLLNSIATWVTRTPDGAPVMPMVCARTWTAAPAAGPG